MQEKFSTRGVFAPDAGHNQNGCNATKSVERENLVTFNDSNSSVEPGEGNDSYRYIEPRES